MQNHLCGRRGYFLKLESVVLRRWGSSIIVLCTVVYKPVAGLVNYMKKKKSDLRKLKRGFDRKRKQEVPRMINQQFNTVPGRVFANLSEILKRDPENERPRYNDPGKRAEMIRECLKTLKRRGGFGESCGKREGLGIRTRPGCRK